MNKEEPHPCPRWNAGYAGCNLREQCDCPPLPQCSPSRVRGAFWRCVCGVTAMPLTDETTCNCTDIYDQQWTRVEGSPGVRGTYKDVTGEQP